MKTLLARFLQDRSAATAIEYALIGSCLSIGIIGAVNNVGTTAAQMYSSVATSLR